MTQTTSNFLKNTDKMGGLPFPFVLAKKNYLSAQVAKKEKAKVTIFEKYCISS